MATDSSKLLDVMQLSDSFFPTGLFTTSNGLESLFSSGEVTTVQELAEFNRICLEQQVGPCDCIILANAHDHSVSKCHAGIKEADAAYNAIRTVREAREASCRSGTQLARCVREFHGGDGTLNWYHGEILNGNVAGAYPVSLAVCCNALGVAKEQSLLMLLYGFVVSTTGAALRLGMIQHFESQKIIHDAKPLIARIAKENSEKGIDEMWQFSPQLDIVQMSHEATDSKMFVT